MDELAAKSGLSPSTVYAVEAGTSASTLAAGRVAAALSRRAELHLSDPRRKEIRPNLSGDVVHSAMGEFEAGHLRGRGHAVGIDEPYQHYQYAGRADLIAWDTTRRAFLHIENRTRFPDFQEMAGAFNGKKAYMGQAIAARLGLRGWASETHVIATLWSSEVLHALRLRTESFRALCPDNADAFEAWWSGGELTVGTSSALIVLDPLASHRQRAWVTLGDALTTRPRYRGYADAASRLEAAGRLAMNGATAAASWSG